MSTLFSTLLAEGLTLDGYASPGLASPLLNATSPHGVLTPTLGSSTGRDGPGRQTAFNAPTDPKFPHLNE